MDTLEKIPWYRTRRFWGGMFSLATLWIIVFFISEINYATRSLADFFDTFTVSIGGSLLTLYGYKFFGAAGGLVAGFIYILIVVFLLAKTFSRKEVLPVYPLILLALIFFGNLLGLAYLGGL